MVGIVNKIYWTMNRFFYRDVTSAMLVPKRNKMTAKQVGVGQVSEFEPYYYVKTFFCFDKFA